LHPGCGRSVIAYAESSCTRMASFTKREIEHCLVNKLQATVDPSGKHTVYIISDDSGTRLGRTMLSHSFRSSTALDDSLVNAIKKQIGLVSSRDFADLVNCPLSREEYIRIVNQ
jgi:hypothetical protein